MNSWYGRVEIGKRSCTVQCQSDSNRVGLDNRRNRDRHFDREVIGYQSGRDWKDRIDRKANFYVVTPPYTPNFIFLDPPP